MRHIKIYEEYSDGDLEDLIGNLEDIGHKHRLIKGEDYGFGRDMKAENNGEELLFLSDFATEKIRKEAEKKFGKPYFYNRNAGLTSLVLPFDGWKDIKGTKVRGTYERHRLIIGDIVRSEGNIYGYTDKTPPYIFILSSGNRKFPLKPQMNRGNKNYLMAKSKVKELYSSLIPFIENIKF